MTATDSRRIEISLPHLDGATAATLLDLCGQLQVVLWRVCGDEIEAFDHLRGEVRMFRVGRIVGARLLDEPVKERLVAQSLFR